jgi:hypothetical protein
VNDSDEDDPVDARLAELLATLAAGDDGDEALVAKVVRTAKWQRTVRRAFGGVTQVVGGLAQGAAVLLGLRKHPEDPRK